MNGGKHLWRCAFDSKVDVTCPRLLLQALYRARLMIDYVYVLCCREIWVDGVSNRYRNDREV
jgi:hypothetical protein